MPSFSADALHGPGVFETLRAMADDGRTVIFISHKLHEVKAVSDRISTRYKPDEIFASPFALPSQWRWAAGSSQELMAVLMPGGHIMLRPVRTGPQVPVARAPAGAPTNAACAQAVTKAKDTSEPVAMITAWALRLRPTSFGSATM